MTAPVIPRNALKVGETDLQVTGGFIIILNFLIICFYINVMCTYYVMQKGHFLIPLVTASQDKASTSLISASHLSLH